VAAPAAPAWAPRSGDTLEAAGALQAAAAKQTALASATDSPPTPPASLESAARAVDPAQLNLPAPEPQLKQPLVQRTTAALLVTVDDDVHEAPPLPAAAPAVAR
jgi:hypothetical protein